MPSLMTHSKGMTAQHRLSLGTPTGPTFPMCRGGPSMFRACCTICKTAPQPYMCLYAVEHCSQGHLLSVQSHIAPASCCLCSLDTIKNRYHMCTFNQSPCMQLASYVCRLSTPVLQSVGHQAAAKMAAAAIGSRPVIRRSQDANVPQIRRHSYTMSAARGAKSMRPPSAGGTGMYFCNRDKYLDDYQSK